MYWADQMQHIFTNAFTSEEHLLRNFMLYAEKETSHTPDANKIMGYEFQHIFVCDEMQHNHPHHVELLCEDGAFLGNAFTRDQYSLWKQKLGKETKAFLLESRFKTVPSYNVKGELYKIRPYKFLDLDKYKENGVSFYRKRITLELPYRLVKWTKQEGVVTTEEKIHHLKAWTYIGMPDYFNPLIDNGYLYGPVRPYSARNYHDYYAFTVKEYDF